MTFILTELSDFGIIMAADSSETRNNNGEESFEEVDKIIYFPELNIGISTWGDALVAGKDINIWLKEIIKEFKQNKNVNDFKNKLLSDISEHIAEKLNEIFPNGEAVLGLHIAGYTYSVELKEYRPGVFHVHNHD